jgi:uncharacterized membrane protein
MRKERFDTITDGIIAIIITLMVLEIKLPQLTVANIWPIILHVAVYGLSFTYIAIGWLNQHHMFVKVEKVDTGTIWTNFAFLFALSLVPLATGPLGEEFQKTESHIFYGAVCTLTSLTYTLLQARVNKMYNHSNNKIKYHMFDVLGIVLYGLSIPLSFVSIYISTIIFIMIPTIYFIQTKRLPKLHELK